MDGERKRRLPLWMSGVTAADPIQKSATSQPLTQAPKRKAIHKTVDKEVGFHEGDALEVDASFVIKRDKGKQIRKQKQQRDLDHDDSIVNGEGGSRNKRVKRKVTGVERTVEECPIPRKKNAKTKGCGSKDVTEASSTSGDEEELTVEDLMNIAEEYVKVDKVKTHQQHATIGSEVDQLLARFDLRSNESGSSDEAVPRSRGNFLEDATLQPSLNVTTTGLETQVRCASYSITRSPKKIGDSTQDMLELLLGPLLKTSYTQERKI